MRRIDIVIVNLVWMMGTSACVTPRIDKPSSAAVSRGDHAGVRFERSETSVAALGFEQDAASQLYVVESLNKVVDGAAKDAPVKTSVTLAPSLDPNAGAIGGSGPYIATIVTEANGETITTKETGSVGSAPLAVASLAAMGVGTVAISVGSAIAPFSPGLFPTLGLAGCGLAALGCGLGVSLVNALQVEKDGSDLLVRAMQKHGEDLRANKRVARTSTSRSREIPPPARVVNTSSSKPSAPRLADVERR